MRRSFFIVLNPSAGVPRRRFFADVIAGLAANGASATVVEHGDPVTAAATVRTALGRHDAIVAAGGDGTVRLVAASIGDAEVPMGLIPLGTGNVLAREIDLPRQAADVVETLLHGEIRTVQGALANGKPFYLMAGIGFDGRTVATLEQRLKRRLGRAAYAHAVLNAFSAPLDELVVNVDGRPYSANWVIVANARHYGGSFILAPRASIFTPGLEAILVRASSRAALLAQLLRLARGRLTAADNRHVTALPAQTLVVTSLKPVPVQLDGDRFNTTPIEIDALGPQVRLIVPGSVDRHEKATENRLI